jgi:plastocyanin
MRTVLAAAAVSLAVGSLTACGGGSSDGTNATASRCRTVTVTVDDFAFAPTPVQVHACDSVVWKNVHDQAHTSTGSGATSWNTGNIAPGATSEAVRFAHAGTFAYVCALHPFMHGEVDVS